MTRAPYDHEFVSRRDYFAIHADQPGRLEIAAAAGVKVRDYAIGDWNSPENVNLPSFNDWFHSLSQAERYRLYAKVRYEIADAMIAASATPTPEGELCDE